MSCAVGGRPARALTRSRRDGDGAPRSDETLGRDVAIKRLSEALSGDEVFRERFMREARTAAGLSHPNIVGVFDVGEEGGIPYIVMECVEDGRSPSCLRSGPLDPDRDGGSDPPGVRGPRARACGGPRPPGHQAAEPARPDDDTLKIVDFGIARPWTDQLTLCGTICRTCYLAPEQALGGGWPPIYSLGAVTYRLLSAAAVRVRARRPGQAREASAADRGVSGELQDAVRRCLAPDPANRPASAAALAHELAQASPEPPTETLPAAEATAATQVIARPRREFRVSRTQVAGAAVLAVAALAAGLAFGLTREATNPPPPAQPVRAGAVPRGDTPTESARVLADWLRARAG